MYILLAVLTVLPSSLCGAHPGEDSLQVYHHPVYFTANAGQWDPEIRYAVLGGVSSAWLCEDGIIFARPKTELDVPKEQALQQRPPGGMETVKIAFRNVSPRMRIVAKDTARTVSHFYVGSDSTSWHESVSNHRVVRYENVWDGVDIEYEEGTGGSLRQNLRIAPGARIPANAFRMSGAGAEEIQEMVAGLLGQQGMADATERPDGSTARTSALGPSGFRYKDTLALTVEFNTAFNFRYGYIRHHVVSGNGEVTLHGQTTDPALPVRSAVQGTLSGPSCVFVIRFDSTGREIRFCTYLGGNNGALLGGGDTWYMHHRYSRTLVNDTEGNLYGIMQASDGAPLTGISYQGFPQYSDKFKLETAGYIYRLNAGGKLTGATYLGGPGALYLDDLSVSDHGVYVIGRNFGDTLAMTPGAILATKPQYNCLALVLCRLSHALDSLRFITYVLTTEYRTGGEDGYTESPSDMAIDAEGNAFITSSVNPYNVDESTLPGLGTGVFSGYWLVKIGLNGDTVLVSRLITDDDIPGAISGGYDYYRGINHMFVNEDGGVDLFGCSNRENPVVSLPVGWLSDVVFDAKNKLPGYPLWGMRLSRSGKFVSGYYYGATGVGVSGTHHFVVQDNVCGGFYHLSLNYRHYDTLLAVDPVDSQRDGNEERFIVNLGENLHVRYATEWNARYLPARADFPKSISLDKHGYCYINARLDYRDNCRYFHSWRIPTGSALDFGQGEMYLARFRIYTPCWQVGCDISAIDTIGIERRRNYASPEEFTVDYAVTNHSPAKGARIVQAGIELPEGFELVSCAPIQPMTPAGLTAGLTATCSWRVRVSDPSVLIDTGMVDTALIRCRVFYVDPESNQTYPMGEELCEKNIAVLLYDEPESEMACTVEGPERLYWVGNGYAVSSAGQTTPVRYTSTLTNLELDTVAIAAFRYRAGPHCVIVGDTIRPGMRLAPGVAHVDAIDMEAGGLRYDRIVTVEVAALDTYGVPIRSCSTETMVPGALDLPCTVTGTERVIWNTASTVASPESIACTLLLENPLDTIRRDVHAWADLSGAPHLGAAAGDSLPRPLFFIAPRFKRALNWSFRIVVPPATHASDTIAFVYESDGVVRSCLHVVEIHVIDEDVTCTLGGLDSLRKADVVSKTPITMQYTLTNTGTVQVEVDHYELEIAPGTGFPTAGLLNLDPLVRSGSMIDPGNAVSIDWRIRASILREARTTHCTVTANDVTDSVLSFCTHAIAIEGVEGLICNLTSVDTVRFNRTSVRYQPETVVMQLTLENLLDTEETNIESVIDLTQAPRLVLDPSESASITIAMIDSHATASLSWKLLPQSAPAAEDQQVTVRYRSDQMSGWKECTATIHIEAWPEEPGITCEAGGHDSLFADWHEERFIPDPLHVSYTVTNTGTIALTGCEASIILPPEFSLAGSDGTQSFTSPEYANQPGGPAPEGTLLPGASCSRWWKITPAKNIADTDPRLITWIWKSNEQGTESGCTHIVNIIPENPPSILLTPLHLYFEAERGGILPVEQQVQLWTGGGLSMPWTAQPSEWWLDAQPTSGSQSTQISVQPNSTLLDVGAHDADLLFAATPTDRHVAITYVIRKSTGIESPSTPGALTLDTWPQPVPAGSRLYVRIGGEAGGRCRLTLHDLLGRQRLTRYAETASPVVIDLGALQLSTGVYLLRAIADNGAQATRMISVTGVR
jgi:hypothetical protein